jgi:type II secretory pathway component PulC
LARVSHEQPSGGFLLNRQLLRKALTRWDHVSATTRLARTGRHRSSGIRVVSLRDAGLLSRLGLRSNDVLRRLNGGSFHDPDLRPVFEALTDGDRNTLTLQRGGQEVTLDYTTR